MSAHPSSWDQKSVDRGLVSGGFKDTPRGTETPLSPSETLHESSNIQPTDGTLQRVPTAQDTLHGPVEVQRTITDSSPLHSVFSKNQKLFIIFMASWAGFFSPVSGQIYFPALNALAEDLHVSNSLINLTLTSYMVRPALLPWQSGADVRGG
jgi:hypothetical protein